MEVAAPSRPINVEKDHEGAVDGLASLPVVIAARLAVSRVFKFHHPINDDMNPFNSRSGFQLVNSFVLAVGSHSVAHVKFQFFESVADQLGVRSEDAAEEVGRAAVKKRTIAAHDAHDPPALLWSGWPREKSGRGTGSCSFRRGGGRSYVGRGYRPTQHW